MLILLYSERFNFLWKQYCWSNVFFVITDMEWHLINNCLICEKIYSKWVFTNNGTMQMLKTNPSDQFLVYEYIYFGVWIKIMCLAVIVLYLRILLLMNMHAVGWLQWDIRWNGTVFMVYCLFKQEKTITKEQLGWTKLSSIIATSVTTSVRQEQKSRGKLCLVCSKV